MKFYEFLLFDLRAGVDIIDRLIKIGKVIEMIYLELWMLYINLCRNVV